MAETVIKEGYKYTQKHEWVKIVGESVEIGISDFAQSNLGDIVFIELPEPGTTLKIDESFGTIESVKAVDELYSPISGEVIEVNSDLDKEPGKVNEDPYNTWILKLKILQNDELNSLMSNEEYSKFIESLN